VTLTSIGSFIISLQSRFLLRTIFLLRIVCFVSATFDLG
jgi:hypothetical protein